MKTPVQVIREARDYCLGRGTWESNKQGWYRGGLAVKADGMAVEPWDESAVAWCEFGSLLAVSHYDSPDQSLAEFCQDIIAKADEDYDNELGKVFGKNDSREDSEYGEVLARFTRAIDFLENEAPMLNTNTKYPTRILVSEEW